MQITITLVPETVARLETMSRVVGLGFEVTIAHILQIASDPNDHFNELLEETLRQEALSRTA